jgi:hypothetical protein
MIRSFHSICIPKVTWGIYSNRTYIFRCGVQTSQLMCRMNLLFSVSCLTFSTQTNGTFGFVLLISLYIFVLCLVFNVASFSGLSILDCHFGFLNMYFSQTTTMKLSRFLLQELKSCSCYFIFNKKKLNGNIF